MFKRLAQLVAILLVAGATLLVGMGRGWFGKKLGAGTIAHSARPASVGPSARDMLNFAEFRPMAFTRSWRGTRSGTSA
jgi:hypothetical protein